MRGTSSSRRLRRRMTIVSDSAASAAGRPMRCQPSGTRGRISCSIHTRVVSAVAAHNVTAHARTMAAMIGSALFTAAMMMMIDDRDACASEQPTNNKRSSPVPTMMLMAQPTNQSISQASKQDTHRSIVFYGISGVLRGRGACEPEDATLLLEPATLALAAEELVDSRQEGCQLPCLRVVQSAGIAV